MGSSTHARASSEPEIVVTGARQPSAPAAPPRRAHSVVSIAGVALACVAAVVLWVELRTPDAPRSPATAAVPAPLPTAPEPTRAGSADHTAALYLDEAEQLLAAHRPDAARELVERAKNEHATDPALVVRSARLGERIVDEELRARARRTSDRADAIEAAQRLLERNPEDAEATRLLTEARGDAAAEPSPATERGKLSVETRAGAAVYLDDRLIGRGSVSRLAVPTGAHVLVVRQAGFSPQRRPIQISRGRETRLAITLASAQVESAPARAQPPAGSPPPPVVSQAPAPSVPERAAPAAAPVAASAPPPAPTTAPVTPPAPSPAPPSPAPPSPAPPAPAEIAAPRLPASYSASTMKELGKVLAVIEGEAVTRGGAPSSLRGVTHLLAEEAFAGFSPGSAIEIHPRAIYYAIVRAARAGKSALAIADELRAGHARGAL